MYAVRMGAVDVCDLMTRADGIGEEEAVTQEFHREIQNFSRLHHPNIVLFIGACLDPLCIVIEYVARGSLADVLKRQRESARKRATASVVSLDQTSQSLAEISATSSDPSHDGGVEQDNWVGVHGGVPWSTRISIAMDVAKGTHTMGGSTSTEAASQTSVQEWRICIRRK